jgi:hypothetical protein
MGDISSGAFKESEITNRMSYLIPRDRRTRPTSLSVGKHSGLGG